MPTVKTSRTPEEVVAFLSRVYDDLSVADHFVNIMPGDIMRNKVKEAMQSLLEQVVTDMPQENVGLCTKKDCECEGGTVDRAFTLGYNEALEDCIAAIKSLQERI